MAGGAGGRPPKPTALKVLEGNPGKRPLPKNEPTPTVRLPSPPAAMNAAAKREWRRLGRVLVGLGLVTDLDVAALAAYCIAYAQLMEATRHIDQEGAHTYVDGYEGQKGPVPGHWETNPWVATQRTAYDVTLKALREFGLSPSSRAKVTAAKPVEELSPFAQMMARRKEGATG